MSTSTWMQSALKTLIFGCLAKRFASADLVQVARQRNEELGCIFDKKCTPVSLQLEDRNIPICDPEQDDIQCFGDVLGHLTSDQQDHCKKTCLVKEYIMAPTYDHGGVIDEEENFMILSLSLEHPPGTKDIREDSLFKHVRTEYLIMPWTSLIANVGGTLGMFIGFSFIGTSEWMMDYLIRIWGLFKFSQTPTGPLQVRTI